ncbi:hypothetical protein TraAM80_01931 [Trypanosoma rangeli]|uniref:Uncharacterized protein n=1 Tax=Trypanosoma rangeli TaxID=5698 RepID=A0A3R7MXY4_TRYRA|nr:uncharacterized protein TraAM80_01931 [Trypanosoma rangeli]RNF09797.1 hypothetical protein TraAM80_01931 [Trypanosoma rangeli]|eukprot:RNF09797.1 hypothetical protein TraAM80_01931 [Trypanosoma rangeli]
MHRAGDRCGCSADEKPLPFTPVDAIRIQQELKHHGGGIIAAEQHGRTFASQYASPLQMLRRSTALCNLPASRCGAEDPLRQGNRSTSRPLRSAPYCRAEPCVFRRKQRGAPQLLHAGDVKPPPFPSSAARLENDVALGLAASLWHSGNVVGQCNDRLAHLLVLSSTVVQSVRCEAQSGLEPHVPLELREALMAVIEHLVRLECVVARAMLLTPVEEEPHQRRAAYPKRHGLSEGYSSGVTATRMSRSAFAVAVRGAALVLMGLVEPATLATASVVPTWQCSLVRTAADVPNRYDILDALADVLRPCRRFTVRRTFCAVARHLALAVLQAAGEGKFGTRGGAAALCILRHINTRPVCLTVEERVAGQCFLAALERKARRLTALLPPDVSDEAIQPTRELIDAVRLFCTPPA